MFNLVSGLIIGYIVILSFMSQLAPSQSNSVCSMEMCSSWVPPNTEDLAQAIAIQDKTLQDSTPRLERSMT